MSENTNAVRAAAQEMTSYNRDELEQALVSEGAYHLVVEGGFHTESLSEEDEQFLITLLAEQGINGLEAYANTTEHSGDRRDIAHITPLVSTSGSAIEELVTRLDDGNEYPGLFLDWDRDSKTYTLYEQGYGDA